MEIDGTKWKDYIIISHNLRKNEENSFRRNEESNIEYYSLVKHQNV